VQRTRTKRAAKKKAAVPTRSTKQAGRPRVRLPRAETTSSSSNSLLLAGGLALFVLVLGDTVFLALSTRYLRIQD
jgi:hypothetical protein